MLDLDGRAVPTVVGLMSSAAAVSNLDESNQSSDRERRESRNDKPCEHAPSPSNFHP